MPIAKHCQSQPHGAETETKRDSLESYTRIPLLRRAEAVLSCTSRRPIYRMATAHCFEVDCTMRGEKYPTLVTLSPVSDSYFFCTSQSLLPNGDRRKSRLDNVVHDRRQPGIIHHPYHSHRKWFITQSSSAVYAPPRRLIRATTSRPSSCRKLTESRNPPMRIFLYGLFWSGSP